MSSRTPEEQSKIAQQFREECIRDGILKPESEAANDERILLRFLRARQYNMEQSKLMMKNSEEWRASVGGGIGMEEFYKDDNNDPLNYPERSVVFQHWPLFFHKTDKKGRPVNIHKFGSINVPELMKVVTPERFVDILTANCEFLPREVLQACSKAAGKRIETVLVIVDLKGFGVSQFWAMKDFVRTSFQISQDYYPETMGQVAVINAPLTFTTMWSAIKPWLAKETVEKVDILGSNYQDALLKLVDADSLPKDLGGNCTCAEHGGDCATSNIGPWMDGRAERRKAWQRGERSKIAVDFGEEEAKKEAAEPLAAEKKTPLPHEDSGMSLAPDAPLEAAVVSALPPSAPGTPDSVAPPTPGRSASDVVEMRGPSSPGTEAPEAPLNASPDEVEQPEQAPLPPSSKQPEQAPLPLSSEQPVTSAEPAQDTQRASVDGTATPYSQASNRSHKSVKSHTSSRLTGLLHRKRPTSMASDHTSSGESSGETVVAEPRKSRFREVVDRVVDKISRQGVEK